MLSEEFSRAGLNVREPIDQRCKYDLRNASDRREVRTIREVRRPRLLPMKFPCALWAQFTRLNYKGEFKQQQLRRKRMKEKPILDFVEEMSFAQLGDRGDILIENPKDSEAHKQSQLKRVEAHPSSHPAPQDSVRLPAAALAAADIGPDMARDRFRLLLKFAFCFHKVL